MFAPNTCLKRGSTLKKQKGKTARRGRGEGSIYQRKNGRWVGAISVRIPGKKSRRPTVTGKSKQAVLLKLAALQNDAAAMPADPSDQTLGVVCAQWLKSLDVSPGTRNSYGYAVKHFGTLADIPLFRLTPMMIEEWLVGLRETNGGATCQKAGNAMRWVCEYAQALGLIRQSPFKSKVPASKPKDIDPFSIDEVREILRRAEGKRGEVVIALAFLCALRQGECFGLKWGDIDWSTGNLSVRRQTVESKGGLQIRKPKTKAGLRTIRLSAMAVEALRRRHAMASIEGVDGADDFVLTAPKSNQPMRRSNFSHRVWGPLLAGKVSAGQGRKQDAADSLPAIRHRGLHHARHTAASTMLQRHVPITEVSVYLGHANPTITLKLYAHAMPGSGALAAASMDQALTCSASAVMPTILPISEAS